MSSLPNQPPPTKPKDLEKISASLRKKFLTDDYREKLTKNGIFGETAKFSSGEERGIDIKKELLEKGGEARKGHLLGLGKLN